MSRSDCNPPHQSHGLAQRLNIGIQTIHMSLRGVYSPYPSPAPPALPYYVRGGSGELGGGSPQPTCLPRRPARTPPCAPRAPPYAQGAAPRRPQGPSRGSQGHPGTPSRAPRAPMKNSHGTAATATFRPPGPPERRPDAPKTSRWTLPGPLKGPLLRKHVKRVYFLALFMLPRAFSIIFIAPRLDLHSF